MAKTSKEIIHAFAAHALETNTPPVNNTPRTNIKDDMKATTLNETGDALRNRIEKAKNFGEPRQLKEKVAMGWFICANTEKKATGETLGIYNFYQYDPNSTPNRDNVQQKYEIYVLKNEVIIHSKTTDILEVMDDVVLAIGSQGELKIVNDNKPKSSCDLM